MGFGFSKYAFHVVKRIMIVLLVFTSVISLFFFFRQDKKIQDNASYMSVQRERIYMNIEAMKKDTSSEGKAKLFVYQGWMCNIIGEACTDNPEDANMNVRNSLSGIITGWITAPYANPPASGIAWLKDGFRDAGFVPETYAATGVGFASIASYMEIWKLFRDIAYLILVLVMITIGFMIMFRVNLGGAAVSIEAALPRIVIAMIMITFSFPIAGFLIDLMYTLIAISVGLFFDVAIQQDALTGEYSSAKEYLNQYMTAGIWQIWPDGGGTYFSVGNSLWRLMPASVQNMFHIAMVVPLAVTAADKFGWMTGKIADLFKGLSLAGFSSGNLAGIPHVVLLSVLFGALVIWGPGLIFGGIIMLTVLLFVFRIFFMLLESYIKILLYIIFAPIILLFSAIPGNGNIGWWLRNLIGELITFPTVIVLTLVGNAVLAVNVRDMDHPFGHLIGGFGIENTFKLPFLYGFQTDDFNTIIALGLVLMIPDFVKMVKGWIGVQDTGLKFGLGTFFAGATIFTGGLGLGANLQSWKQSAVGYDPNKGWMDTMPFMSKYAEKIRSWGKT